MTKKLKSTPTPFSLRLSINERDRLERDAPGLSLGQYIRQRIFDESLPKRLTRGKYSIKDYKILSQLLGKLGTSRLSSNTGRL